MSDFITRLVERTLGLCEVVQPVVTPSFGNELDKEDGFSTTPALEEEVLESEEETQPSGFSKTEASSWKGDIASESPAPNRITVPERPRRSHNLTDYRPDSKDDVVEETDKRSESDPLVSKQKVGGELFPPPEKSQGNASPTRDRKAKKVILAPIETSGNIDLSEKGDVGAAKSHSLKASPAHSEESPRPTEKFQNADKQARSLRPLVPRDLFARRCLSGRGKRDQLYKTITLLRRRHLQCFLPSK